MSEHNKIIYRWEPYLNRIFFLCFCGCILNFPDFGSAYCYCPRCKKGWEFDVATGQIIGYWVHYKAGGVEN
jgi:hypothetical protein